MNGWDVATGLKFAVKLPNADDKKEFGTDETDIFVGLAGAKQLGPVLTVVNADFAILGEPNTSTTDQDDVLIYGLVGLHRIDGGAHAGIGLEGLIFSRYGNNRMAANACLSFPWRGLGIDLGAGWGLSGKAPDWTATLGVSLQFGGPTEVICPQPVENQEIAPTPRSDNAQGIHP